MQKYGGPVSLGWFIGGFLLAAIVVGMVHLLRWGIAALFARQ